jgi:hypothetical protein
MRPETHEATRHEKDPATTITWSLTLSCLTKIKLPPKQQIRNALVIIVKVKEREIVRVKILGRQAPALDTDLGMPGEFGRTWMGGEELPGVLDREVGQNWVLKLLLNQV